MEIIDRPLSEVIKEQKIGQELRRSRGPFQRKGNNSQGSGNRNNNRSAGEQNKGNNRSRRGGNTDNRRGDPPSRRNNRSRRLRGLRDDNRRRGGVTTGIRRRGPLSALRGADSRRDSRRGAMDYGDVRRPVGVKGFGASRRSRISVSDRNERIRRRGRDTALETARRSRR